MVKLEEVRLTPYETTAIPAGMTIVSVNKSRRIPIRGGWNWYSRWDSVGHYVHHALADALTKGGITVDELKANVPEEKRPEVDRIVKIFKDGVASFCGWDLVADASGNKMALVFRDPVEFYAKEHNVTFQPEEVKLAPTPSYVKQVPQLIEEAKNPKPVKEPSAPRAPRAPRAKSEAKPSSAQPTGGYVKALEAVDVNFGHLVSQYVEQNATIKLKNAKEGDAPVNVREHMTSLFDQYGAEGGPFIDFLGYAQSQSVVKTGLFKLVKESWKKYEDSKKVQPQAAAQPVSA